MRPMTARGGGRTGGWALAALLAAGACAQGPERAAKDPGALAEATRGAAFASGDAPPLPGLAPPGADPSLCWARDVAPAVVETVTERVPSPGAEGFETRTEQRIARERREQWFETPCPPAMDIHFVASLQRALKARGLYDGAITGRMDAATRAAVRAFQAPRGLDSAEVSMEAARAMGLAPVRLAREP